MSFHKHLDPSFAKAYVKPPLGIMPMFLWVELRIKAIDEAISRYEACGMPIPEEWLMEKVYHANQYHVMEKLKLVARSRWESTKSHE